MWICLKVAGVPVLEILCVAWSGAGVEVLRQGVASRGVGSGGVCVRQSPCVVVHDAFLRTG